MADQTVGRRQTLKYFGILAGTVAGRQFLEEWLPSPSGSAAPRAGRGGSGCEMHQVNTSESGEGMPYQPRFFKKDEFQTVEDLTGLIIPSDDTPGAKEAQVARYID